MNEAPGGAAATLPEQSIRFCTTSDGVRIAYSIAGSGPPLVRAADWLNHLEFEWRAPINRHWLQELSRGRTLIRYDQRGTGLSDRNVEQMGLEAWLLDLEAVVAAAGIHEFALFAGHYSGPVAVAYAVRHPERLTHLVLYGSYATGWKHRDLSARALEEWQAVLTLTRGGFGRDDPAFRRMYADLLLPNASEEQMRLFVQLARMAATGKSAAAIMDAAGDSNVEELLAKVTIPTLVVHCNGDSRVPFEWGRRLAAGIHSAQFVSLESANHYIQEDEPAWQDFQRVLRSFLASGATE